jgi:hypothetical protein
METDILPTDVIGDNVKDVGRSILGRCGKQGEKAEQQGIDSEFHGHHEV